MSYWDLSQEEQDRLSEAGVDYDLRACIEYNSSSFPFDVTSIEKVLAAWTGENDGDDWRWVVKVKKSQENEKGYRYVFIQGGCDYTGWDCQSWGTCQFEKTALKAAHLSLGDVQVGESQPFNAGLGHMLNILSGSYGSNMKDVYNSLVEQINSTKKKTWHEQKDEELGTKNLPKL